MSKFALSPRDDTEWRLDPRALADRLRERWVPDSAFIGAYWGPRGEPVEACADRLERMLRGFSDADPLLADWYLKGATRTKALQRRVARDRSTLRDLLSGHRHRTDFGGDVMEELGYRFAAWNGHDASVSLSLTCGGWTSEVPNRVIVDFSGTAVRALAEKRQVLYTALQVVARSWEPEWATFASPSLCDEQDAMSRSDRYAGWITYVQAHEPDGLPAQARIEDWGAGSAIVLGEPFEPIATGDLIAVQRVIDRSSSNASESSSPA